MAKKKNEKRQPKKKGAGNNAKKAKSKKANSSLPRNARSNKKRPAKTRQVKEPKYIDVGNGKFKDSKTGRFVKLTDRQKSYWSKAQGSKRTRTKESKKNRLPAEDYYTTSIKSEIENPLYNTQRITIIDLNGERTVTSSYAEAILTIENENDIVWELVDLSREILKEIDSPQIFIPIVKYEDAGVTPQGQIDRTLVIDYQNINTGSIPSDVWDEARDIYG